MREHDSLGYLQLAGALGWFWAIRPPYAEASRRVEDALAARAEDDRLIARALRWLAVLESYSGRFGAARVASGWRSRSGWPATTTPSCLEPATS